MPRWNDTQQPDIQPGNYYVSVRRDDGKQALLSGPYPDDHEAALDAVFAAKEKLDEVDINAIWYAYGTARMPSDYREPGFLQRHFDYPL